MKNLWWGYLHTNGTIQAKRYFSELDIKEAKESDFIKCVCNSFESDNREEAIKILTNYFKIRRMI